MQKGYKEEKAIIYNDSSTKILHFDFSEPRNCFTMHWHERFEFLLVRRGSMSYTINGESGVANAGEAVIIPPGCTHFAKTDGGLIYDVLMFDVRNFYNQTAVCNKVLTEIFEGSMDCVTKTSDSRITDCISKLCSSIGSNSVEAVANIYMLIHLLVDSGCIILTSKPKDKAVKEIIKYIEENFDKDLTTATLSDIFGYCPAHFCRKFKKATGLAPIAYLKIYRLEKAFKMIKNGENRIFEIAKDCGFSDTNYFTRAFTAHYGHPPTYFK